MSRFSPIVFRTSLLLEDVAVFCGAQGKKLVSNENKLVQMWEISKIEAIKIKKNAFEFLQTRSPTTVRPCYGCGHPTTLCYRMGRKTRSRGLQAHQKLQLYSSRARSLSVSMIPNELGFYPAHLRAFLRGCLRSRSTFQGRHFKRGINATNFIRKELLAIVKQRKVDLPKGKATHTQEILSHILLYSDEDGRFMAKYDIADKILGGADWWSRHCKLGLRVYC
jgi:hypothetical protein